MSPSASPKLVIFGCGYVGTAVALEALRRGVKVTALTRNATNAHVLREQGVATVIADLASDHWHAELRGPFTFALNCVSSGGGGLENYARSYRDGMRSIVAWMKGHGPVGTCVYTSSTSVYPQGEGVAVIETSSTDGASERGKIIRESEKTLVEAEGVCSRWFVLRLAGIYGPGRHHLLEQVRLGTVAGRGEHRLNLIHRDDIVRAIWSCFDSPTELANEVFNVADDAPTPKRDVVNWLAQRVGCPSPRFTGEPVGQRQTLTPDRLIVNRKIRDMLGWRPAFPDYRAGFNDLLSC